ncbi:MAG: hypothetical protein M3511_04660, partial [Deinococcota bacterium]|nr:hypothetical protein [Deinococcota bacterium]
LYVLKLFSTTRISYKCLLGILNSRFLGWYFRKKFQISHEDTFPQIMIGDIMQFPVPILTDGQDTCLSTLSTQILTAKEQDSNADVSALERQIDALVYELYGLTDEEIAMVEGR